MCAALYVTGAQVMEFCPHGTKVECTKVNSAEPCKKLHFKKIIQKHTDESLGDCSFLNTCFHMDTCKYVLLNVRVWFCGGHYHDQMLCPHSCMGRPCLILGVHTWKLQWRVNHIVTAITNSKRAATTGCWRSHQLLMFVHF